MAKSVLQKNKECYLCRKLFDEENIYNLHEHHVYGGKGRRSISERVGMKVFLCAPHHNMSDEGVHFNSRADMLLKQEAQRFYEANIGTREQFIELFGQSYL